jgi:flagellar hook-length control protein FliK
MLTIGPAPVLPAALPDSAPPALFGPGEAEGADFATELALAMAGAEPAKLRPAAPPGDRIRLTMVVPGSDMDEGPVRRETDAVRSVPPLGDLPAEAATAPTEQVAVPPAAPGPESPRAARPAAAPPPLTPLHETAPLRDAAPSLVAEATATAADVPADLPQAPVGPATTPGDGAGPEADETPHPVRRVPADAPAEGTARPIAARPTRPAEPPILSDAEAGDRAERPRPDAAPEAPRPPAAARPDVPPPPAPERTVVAGPAEPAETHRAAAAPDHPAAEAGDAVPTEQPVPDAFAQEPTPEAIGLAAAATPATRPAGDPSRTRGGVSTTGATNAAPIAAPPGDAAEPKLRPAPAEATPRAPADARPGTAEAPPRAGLSPSEPAVDADAAEPSSSSAERPDPQTPRAEPTARALAQPGMPAEALPQLQPVERSAAPAAAPAPPRPAPAPPAQQLAPVLITLAAGAAGMPDRLMLTLDPQELGRIEVEVTREGERRVAIAVLAERPETLHLLMRDAAILDRALAQAGVGAEGRSLAFDLGGGSDGRQQRGSASGTPAASPSPQPEPARPRDPLSLLDIAI